MAPHAPVAGTLRSHLPASGIGEGDVELSEVLWFSTEGPRGIMADGGSWRLSRADRLRA